ncbi:UDP-N-acetylmuramoyl-L-alanyl-D-glutamate--2,6-diaminopimelate ligase [Brachybacterium endophyticum]|uniref:UDP-N-acetylmuramoyl-L-alanyl-D-glutamate--2, 6-diaminopimelate ligase n=1 Tax=Brachybacterium endophyticum TaxID=2182385 RepID=UPI001F0CCCAF|nr:UDP-N-acetylmuramoyl-L-alanyl-D-glutamate--2,6-diaminopimelate ligase [Brachybacterium endophyticum]
MTPAEGTEGAPGAEEVVPPRPRRAAGLSAGDLARLLDAEVVGPVTEEALQGATLDSRSVRPGDLYCALPGARTHGARFAGQAAEAGALAALTDPVGAQECVRAGLTALVLDDPRTATAAAAAEVYGRPAQQLTTIGVTGTNGKTSVTTMLQRALLELAVPVGMIGTSGTEYHDGDGRDVRIGTVRTTPEAPDVQGILARMLEDDVAVCAMEVSSHAMVLHRADEILFDVACFTNLSQDHLDFHPTMEDYFRAKASLFAPEHARRGVVCVDDEWGARLAGEARIPVTTFTTDPRREADVVVEQVEASGFGSDFTVRMPGGERHRLSSQIPGMPYVANTVAVMLLLAAIGHDGEHVRETVSRAGVVPGRMELVAEHPVRGVVDFSHTEDALAKTLATLRAVPGTRRLIAVIGAGGDRDRGKRPHMGAVAADLADVVIITDDNPRSEDPASIREQVRAGIDGSTTADVHVVAGRENAIDLACELADVGDTILLAGKGAEKGQTIGDTVLPFDDRVQLRRRLAGSDAAPAARGADSPTPRDDEGL